MAKWRKVCGTFKDNKFHWQGTFWPNGEKYIGNHKDGVADGMGTHTWHERDMLAITKMDFQCQGTHTWPDGELKEEFGRWVNLWVTSCANEDIENKLSVAANISQQSSKATDCVRCDSTAAYLQDQQVKHNSKPSKARLQNQGREITAVWPKAEQNSIGIPSTLLSR